ncbi:MAG: 2-amino-4-hydroxy-6-hydroxymethyldihydropteridine diphosphokinase [Halioglobus sp.]
MTAAYIALGSNLSNPGRQLRSAVAALDLLPQTQLNRVSSVYRSAAVGPVAQPDYLNAVALLTTELSPISLLDALQQIERDHHRVRDVYWGPRTLDLDLLLYGEMAIVSPRLTVPHPQMSLRHFVLYPLREISNGNLQLPDGTDLDTLLRHCPLEGLARTRIQLRTPSSAHSR